jgi:hypothetical protein
MSAESVETKDRRSAMSLVHRPRKDHRARAPKRIRRRKLDKFIPDSDSDFAMTSQQFAWAIARDPALYFLTVEDAQNISSAVKEFRAALRKSIHKFTRTQQAVMSKDLARAKLEDIVRSYGDPIRANRKISDIDKMLVRVKEQPKRKKKRSCPDKAPILRYRGPLDTGGPGSHRHVLEYADADMYGKTTIKKPDGAVRIELCVELVPQGTARVPKHPAELTGRPWHLRSYTTSTMVVEFPMPSEPMLVVYWGRWADSKGNVGPYSKTCVARVEGWSNGAGAAALPEEYEARRVETKIVFIQTPYALTDQSMQTMDSVVERPLLEAA